MPIKLNLVGDTYGKLKVLKESDKKIHNRVSWVCICTCGDKKIATSNDLRTNKIKTCGKFKCRDVDLTNFRKSAIKHRGTSTRLYTIWAGMKHRCGTHKNYKGIFFSSEWKDFLPFKIWALRTGYKNHLTLDRIDNDKGYSPENCRWASREQQANNRKNNTIFKYKGKEYSLKSLAFEYNVNSKSLKYRLDTGMSIKRSLNKEGIGPYEY